MTAHPPAIGSLLPALADGPPVEGSVWEAWTAGYAHAFAFRTARGALAAVLRGWFEVARPSPFPSHPGEGRDPVPGARKPELAISAPGMGPRSELGPGLRRDDWVEVEVQRSARAARVWLPAYACEALLAAVPAIGAEPRWYDPGERLRLDPAALTDVADGDAVVVIDYFGRSPPPEVAALAASRPGVLWIEDRAQALAPDAPTFGDVVLYSPRKLFGVGDGGLAVSNAPLPSPTGCAGGDDWAPNDARALDQNGDAPERWFPVLLAREAGFAVDGAAMSPRTRAALAATPLAVEADARRANWCALADRLAHFALWPEREVAFAPLAFAIVIDDAGALAAKLAQERIWCARHWATLPSPADRFPEAHALADGCLSLPIDGRYGPAEMGRVAEAVLRLQPR